MAAVTNVGIHWMIFIGLMLGPMGFADIISTDKKSSKKSIMRLAIDGDYIGCYTLKCMELPYHPVVSTLNTPDSCTAKCKEDGFSVAMLYNITECGCTCLHGPSVEACLVKKLKDNFCGLPCQNNSKKMCGGYTAMAVYQVALTNASKTNCSVDYQQNRDIGDIDSNRSTEAFGFVRILIVAGVGATVVISLVVTFACVRQITVRRNVTMVPIQRHVSDRKAHSGKSPKPGRQNQGLNQTPSSECPGVSDGGVEETPALHDHAGNELKNHDYVEAGPVERPRPPPTTPRMHGPTSEASSTRTTTLDEIHEYIYVKPIKSLSKNEEDIIEDEEGYLTPNRPNVSPQIPHRPYFSSRIPKPRCSNRLPDGTPSDGVSESSCKPTSTLNEINEYTYVKPIKSLSKNEEDIIEDEQGYLTPNRPKVYPQFPHGPYYSSRIPKPSCSNPLPDTPSDKVYYSSKLPMPSIQD